MPNASDRDYPEGTESMQAGPAASSNEGSAAASSQRPGRRGRRRTDTAAIIDGVGPTPWARVKNRMPVPKPITVAELEALAPAAFARLIRDHLMPASPEGPERIAWGQLWALLRRDDRLAHRTFDVLEQLLDMTAVARAAGSLDDAGARRAAKFADALEHAWRRLEITSDEPLAWAGQSAEAFNRAARSVIDSLVSAIADHRRTVLAGSGADDVDRRLWEVLAQLDLDPDPRHAHSSDDHRESGPR